MRRITADLPHPLHDVAATRRIERAAAARLPPQTLMVRAGSAVARLARAVAPHANHVWLACGPGNNGGDGLEAAFQLRCAGVHVTVTWLGDERHCPDDARASWQRARDAGVTFAAGPPEGLTARDLQIDALLGIGAVANRPGDHRNRLGPVMAPLRSGTAPVLAVDLPSGLHGDTGRFAIDLTARKPGGTRASIDFYAQNTLNLLTLKPGLFTASGRDASGQVWFDDLGVEHEEPPTAWLIGTPTVHPRQHASHKGTYGDVAVVGGEGMAHHGQAMAGAALLAASAALYAGAGRVVVSLLDESHPGLDPFQPELMFRHFETLDLSRFTVVCGCGGGKSVAAVLPRILADARNLVLDADALNAIADSAALQAQLVQRSRERRSTVLTPHPLEAARLLGVSADDVQADRLRAAQRLAEEFCCVVVLKGSGTIVAEPSRLPALNPTGNARLATAGTGDVLAGMIAGGWAGGASAFTVASAAVYRHGALADAWPAALPLVAGALARQASF